MLQQLQSSKVKCTLPSTVKYIFLLYDKKFMEMNTILIIEDSNYQLYFDEGMLFLHDTETSLNDYLTDFDQEIIFTIENSKQHSFEIKYEKNYLFIKYSQSTYFKFLIKNDNFLTCCPVPPSQ